jgi:hypothetical protein
MANYEWQIGVTDMKYNNEGYKTNHLHATVNNVLSNLPVNTKKPEYISDRHEHKKFYKKRQEFVTKCNKMNGFVISDAGSMRCIPVLKRHKLPDGIIPFKGHTDNIGFNNKAEMEKATKNKI